MASRHPDDVRSGDAVSLRARGPHFAHRAFVGREERLRDLRASLEGAKSGKGQSVLLLGEPGIGKTRLADEIASEAREAGVRVLWVRCWEEGGAPAYWPWAQLIRSYLRHADPELVKTPLGRQAASLARLVLEVGSGLPRTASAKALLDPTPEPARFEVFDAVASFFREISSARPLLVVFDDLHAADPSSLLLLRHLIEASKDRRVFVIGTCRSAVGRAEPSISPLAEIAGHSRCLEVGGLSRDETALLMEQALGFTPDFALAGAVHEATEGIPFFIEEIVRLLAVEGSPVRERGSSRPSFRIPDGVHEAIRRRVSSLSEGCRQLLSVASVIGREFERGLLEPVSGLAAGRLGELLAEALAIGVLVEVGGGGRWRFSPSLVRETLYADLSTEARERLHRKIGEELEALRESGRPVRPVELAHHFFRGANSGVTDKAVDYSCRAAEEAERQLAFAGAADHLANALRLLETRGAAAARQRCELLLSLGEALVRAGETSKVRRAFREAAEIARTLHAPKLLAAAALALAALPAEDTTARARLLDRPAREDVTRPDTPQSPAAEAAVFHREGEFWSVSYRGTSFRLKDARGMRHLAELLRHPGREFLATDLGADLGTEVEGSAAKLDHGDAGEVLDSRARSAYRRRLEALGEAAAGAESAGDAGAAARCRQEVALLRSELARGFGLGGRARRAASRPERARQAVGKAIGTAVRSIEARSPALARHFTASVHAGVFCSYDPHASKPIAWTL